ncbi:MAG: 5-oxoprolinase [Actinomycetia bacterium]|nr:5-oxoprolinase [Actinomycetes bacterium]
MTELPSLRVAVDIGGTFTDFVVFDAKTGSVRVGKVLSSPDDSVRAVLLGLERLNVDLANVDFFVHGTTVGLNLIVQGKGANVALITTKGFRDVLEIGLMEKKEMYNLFYERPRPLVERQNRFEIDERVDGFGQVLRPVDDAELAQVAEAIRASGAQTVAVATLNAYVEPANEASIGRALANELGDDVFVSVSHEIANEWREFERTSTTVLNAYVLPVFKKYLSEIRTRLSERGLRSEVNIMKSSGGIMSAEAAAVRPIHSLLSGPVGGAVGAQALARLARAGDASHLANLVTADMGGTSFDASLVVEGEIEVDTRADAHGYPMLVPTVRVNAIGAGGGSIARVEGSSGLRVGPESAGASPGPVCYGQGGVEPTVTDANLVLGRLDPNGVLGDEIALDLDAATNAIEERVARPLGLSVHEAAEGILRVINSKMALAIRELTVAQGLDPADFALVAFGGAGPMHAAEICAELGIRTAVIPPVPGMFSAWGMLAADVRHDLSATAVVQAAHLEKQVVGKRFAELEREGREALGAQGVGEAAMSFTHFLDLRYVGQEHTLTVPVDIDVDPADLKRVFDEAHRRKYGHHSEEDAAEVVNFRVAAVGAVAKPELARVDVQARSGSRVGERDVFFGGAFHTTPVYRRADLGSETLRGPLVVDEDGSTTIVPPGFDLRVDSYGNLVLAAGAAQ